MPTRPYACQVSVSGRSRSAARLCSVSQQLDRTHEAAIGLYDALRSLVDALLSLPEPPGSESTVAHLRLVVHQAMRALDTHSEVAGGNGG